MAPRSKKTTEEKEPIENIKDLIGFKWSTIVGWLVGLIPSAAFFGFFVGQWVANSDKKQEINDLNYRHQRELIEARDAARKEGIEEYKQANSEAQSIVEIIKEVRKK